MTRLRYKMIVEWESDFDPQAYFDSTVEPPRQMTLEEAKACDRESILDDPGAFLEQGEIKVEITEISP